MSGKGSTAFTRPAVFLNKLLNASSELATEQKTLAVFKSGAAFLFCARNESSGPEQGEVGKGEEGAAGEGGYCLCWAWQRGA